MVLIELGSNSPKSGEKGPSAGSRVPQPLLVRNGLLQLLVLCASTLVCVCVGGGMLIIQNFSEGVRIKMLRYSPLTSEVLRGAVHFAGLRENKDILVSGEFQ